MKIVKWNIENVERQNPTTNNLIPCETILQKGRKKKFVTGINRKCVAKRSTLQEMLKVL